MIKPIKNGLILATLIFLTIATTTTTKIDTAAREGHTLYPETKAMLETHKEEVEAEKLKAEEELQKRHEVQKQANKYIAQTTLDELAEKNAGPKMSLVGTYQLTAYIATGNCCASGVYPTVGRTVACNSLPLGTRIYIEGYGEYVVEDTGGMGGGVIDVFVGSYGEAISFGRRSANVYIIED